MKIGVLGAGGWGSALANLLAGNGHEVIVWSIDEREVAMLKEFHEQRDRLPGVILNSSIEYTTDASKAVIGQKMIVCAVPSPFVRSTAKRVMPIENEVIWEYSNGELVKSETLGVWKTHDGMDIAASVGTDVKAACTGKVKEIKDDPLWGICVVIDHGDGYETHYYGLDKSLEVKEGSNVESGQKIGVTGTIECESKLAPHLHFAVKQNGKWVSPKEYING